MLCSNISIFDNTEALVSSTKQAAQEYTSRVELKKNGIHFSILNFLNDKTVFLQLKSFNRAFLKGDFILYLISFNWVR